jgi:hypothetical protein
VPVEQTQMVQRWRVRAALLALTSIWWGWGDTQRIMWVYRAAPPYPLLQTRNRHEPEPYNVASPELWSRTPRHLQQMNEWLAHRRSPEWEPDGPDDGTGHGW